MQRYKWSFIGKLGLAGFLVGGVLMFLTSTGSAGPGDTGDGVQTTPTIDGPVEMGRVRWLRSYEDGVARSEETGKPMMLLFQEVPG